MDRVLQSPRIGRRLKIAVIDTGVNATHPHICAPIRGVLFDPEETDHSTEDLLGHGTAVTAAIQEKAPEAEYFILRLFGNSLRTTADRLIRALQWTIDNGIDVVNLSLGSANLRHRSALESLVNRAVEARVLVVAARYAGPNPALPGILGGVVSVNVDWTLPRDQYRMSDDDGALVFYASGLPRPLPGVPVNRNLSGISFAVANMTGFVARACEDVEERSLDSIRRALTVRAVYDRAVIEG